MVERGVGLVSISEISSKAMTPAIVTRIGPKALSAPATIPTQLIGLDWRFRKAKMPKTIAAIPISKPSIGTHPSKKPMMPMTIEETAKPFATGCCGGIDGGGGGRRGGE